MKPRYFHTKITDLKQLTSKMLFSQQHYPTCADIFYCPIAHNQFSYTQTIDTMRLPFAPFQLRVSGARPSLRLKWSESTFDVFRFGFGKLTFFWRDQSFKKLKNNKKIMKEKKKEVQLLTDVGNGVFCVWTVRSHIAWDFSIHSFFPSRLCFFSLVRCFLLYYNRRTCERGKK